MKKKLLFGFLLVLVAVIIALFFAISPSGEIKNYEKYYVNDNAPITDGAVKITFFGVSTLLLDDGETQILLDGFFSRPSIWTALTAKIKSDTALIDKIVTRYKMDRVKGIFTTHSHYDHAFDVAYTTKKTQAMLFGSLSTLNIGRGGGLSEKQLTTFKPNEIYNLGKFSVQVLPSKHSEPNSLNDSGVQIKNALSQPASIKDYHEGGTYDFLIKHNGHSVYVKPSPNYVMGMLDTLKADVLLLGIGTIGKKETGWQNTFYEQTVGKLNPKILIPIHWDDFTKPLSENLEMLPHFATKGSKDFDFMIEKTKANHIDFKILQGTKSILLFK